MHDAAIPLDSLWDSLLSRDAELIRQAFSSLSEAEKAFVLEHLKRMQTESGWYPQQRQSAVDALIALGQI
jgi:NADH:ubiquinone oxidoreductase subunit E